MAPRRVPLVLLPTPLHRLDRVSEDLGIDLWIKRDDLTGFAMGGNKGRKLEFLIAAALDSGADTVLTCGSIQSNFIRQLAAACAVVGLRMVAVVMGLPFEFVRPSEPGLVDAGGNVLLGGLLGADLRIMPDDTWESLFLEMDRVGDELEASGRRVHRIPVGGSSPLGAYAFYQASAELPSDVDFIVTASSSGSTQTGLSYGLAGTQTRVLGIACDPEPELVHEFAQLATGLEELVGRGIALEATDFEFDVRFVGDGYGIPSHEGMAALRYLAQREGIFLDPIYSAKAFAGLVARAKEGSIYGKVVFWHTGGIPALFAMSEGAHSGEGIS